MGMMLLLASLKSCSIDSGGGRGTGSSRLMLRDRKLSSLGSCYLEQMRSRTGIDKSRKASSMDAFSIVGQLSENSLRIVTDSLR